MAMLNSQRVNPQLFKPGFAEDDFTFFESEIHYDWGIYREYVFFFCSFSKSK